MRRVVLVVRGGLVGVFAVGPLVGVVSRLQRAAQSGECKNNTEEEIKIPADNYRQFASMLNLSPMVKCVWIVTGMLKISD